MGALYGVRAAAVDAAVRGSSVVEGVWAVDVAPGFGMRCCARGELDAGGGDTETETEAATAGVVGRQMRGRLANAWRMGEIHHHRSLQTPQHRIPTNWDGPHLKL
jgi:hypothetical protein